MSQNQELCMKEVSFYNNRIMRKIIGMLTLMTLVSCIENEVDNSEINQIGDLKSSKMRIVRLSDMQKSDSLIIVSRLQSDMDIKVIRNISIEDGEYKLNLTLKTALELGVNEETYNKYRVYVENLND